jgi:predicted acyltransferase
VGVSLVYALDGVKQRGGPQGAVLGRVLRRAAVLFGLGLLLSLYPKFDFSGVASWACCSALRWCFWGAALSF